MSHQSLTELVVMMMMLCGLCREGLPFGMMDKIENCMPTVG
jgi:hypothetical protein